jgi:hypothetical protein
MHNSPNRPTQLQEVKNNPRLISLSRNHAGFVQRESEAHNGDNSMTSRPEFESALGSLPWRLASTLAIVGDRLL